MKCQIHQFVNVRYLYSAKCFIGIYLLLIGQTAYLCGIHVSVEITQLYCSSYVSMLYAIKWFSQILH